MSRINPKICCSTAELGLFDRITPVLAFQLVFLAPCYWFLRLYWIIYLSFLAAYDLRRQPGWFLLFLKRGNICTHCPEVMEKNSLFFSADLTSSGGLCLWFIDGSSYFCVSFAWFHWVHVVFSCIRLSDYFYCLLLLLTLLGLCCFFYFVKALCEMAFGAALNK